MFLQLILPKSAPFDAVALQAADSLFLYTPLQVSALVETVWRNRFNAISSSFTPWPRWVTDALLSDTAPGGAGPNFSAGFDFTTPTPTALPQWPFPALPTSSLPFLAPNRLPGVALDPAGNVVATNWDHLIYAYLLENTRIFDIFARLLETYAFSEQLETPSPAAQNFWRITEYMVYGDGLPSMLWSTTSRARRDEVANRQTVYNWMFGIDLSHAPELAKEHPYTKPAASNRDFVPTFEAFAREVWGGIMNAKNTSGANPSDPAAIATAARRIFDMMATRRINGNLSREEFRAVALMSWLHLAVMYDSPAVVDLKAAASSPEQRLAKLASRVGLTSHTKAKPLFDLAQPFSILMQFIESGTFNNSAGAQLLITLGDPAQLNAEVVIDQYSLATGRDLKATSVVDRSPKPAPSPARLPVVARPRTLPT